jgi:hypothetical protein
MTLGGRAKVRSHLTLIKVKFVFCSRKAIITSLSCLTLLYSIEKSKQMQSRVLFESLPTFQGGGL